MPTCECSEKDIPIAYPIGSMGLYPDCKAPMVNGRRIYRLWRVRVRNRSNSAFSRAGGTWSASSAVECLRCGRIWRTKASYVNELADIADDERNISCGVDGHAAAMRARGREPHENHAGEG